MGQRFAGATVCALMMVVVVESAAWADGASVADAVFAFFQTHTSEPVDVFLARLRPAPLDAPSRQQVMASLPEQGELTPTAAEARKIAAAQRVLDYSARTDLVVFKVIDLDDAEVGLYFRTVLLASRRALAVLDADEFAAIAAHELSHDMEWNEYWGALKRKDHERLRELELRCDGIAVLVLRRVGINPDRLITGVRKLTRYNEWRKMTATTTDYVPLPERVAFIRRMTRLRWVGASPERLASKATPRPRP